MRSTLSLILAFGLLTVNAFARSEVVARIKHAPTADSKFEADLYFDAETKQADLWVYFYRGPQPDAPKLEFKATSVPERMRDAHLRLIPSPAAQRDTLIIQTFNSYRIGNYTDPKDPTNSFKEGDFFKDGSFTLHVRQPIRSLPRATVAMLLKDFPNSIVYDERRRPKYVKCLLTHATAYQVYPIAAFDVEPGLLGSQ